MSKAILSLGAFIALAAIFIIPSANSPTHVAKASQCSFSFSSPKLGQQAGSFTTSGSCASSTAAGQTSAILGGNGGSKSTCSTGSASQTGLPGGSTTTSNGAVSCSSHSP